MRVSAVVAVCAQVAVAVGSSSALAASLTIATSSNFSTLDPHQALAMEPDLSAASQIYSPLLIRDPDLKLRGVVAQSWKPVNDTTWSFKLHPNLKFPNGEPLDAEAVRWNLARMLDPATKARTRAWYAMIKGAKVVSPTEVHVETHEPFPGLPAQLSMFFLLPPKWTATHNPAVETNGTGPYEVVSYVPGERLVLKARKNAIGGKKPDFDDVTIKVVKDGSARIAALLSGEVDVVGEIPPSELARLNASKRATVGWVPGGRSMTIRFNNSKVPVKDQLALRQAMNYAVDKNAILKGVFDGLGSVSTCQIMSTHYAGYNNDLKPYPYDPAKARALIARSGLTTPIDVEFEVPQGRYLLASETAQVVAAQLQEVGIRVKLKEMEFASWLTKYSQKNMAQMAIMTQGFSTLDAAGVLSLYDPVYPSAYWDDAVFADLLRKGRREMDQNKRNAIYKAATERMCEQAPIIFMLVLPVTYGTSAKVDWKPRPDDWVRAFEMKLRK